MRFQHILELVYCRPWLITEAGHAAIRALLDTHLAESFPREGEDWWTGKAEKLPGLEIDDGVAMIPVQGVIGQKLSRIEKSCGACDVGDVSRELALASSRPDVRGIVLDFDTPGGMVTGTPELAEEIRAASLAGGGKPVFAFTDNQVASAGYWLASAADQVYTTRTAEVGSIGVYMPWRDTSQAHANAGVKVDLIKAGRYKGMGYPGTSLTQDQRELLQDQVNGIYAMFTGHVQAMRGDVSKETMQGQMFMASAAKARNLIDGIVKDRATVVRMLR